MNQLLHTNAQKLDYLLEHYMSATEVTRAFGFKSNTMISNMRKGQTNVATLHMEGLETHFGIPKEIFTNQISNSEEIDSLIENYKIRKTDETNNTLSNSVFPNNEKLFQKLKGVWYGYLYPSNPASAKHGVWEVKTIIKDDYSVVDEPWGNRGYIQLGKHESLIIKESYDNDDLTIIRFSNRQVPSAHFRFVIISNQNNTLHEMVNFGFFSRKQYNPNEAKEILGDIESKQLKLDLEFNDRLNERAVVPE